MPIPIRLLPLTWSVLLLALLPSPLPAFSGTGEPPAVLSGDYATAGLIGNSLPGSWRPFADRSDWNTPLPAFLPAHPDSQRIISLAAKTAGNIRFAGKYLPPVWVVNADNIEQTFVGSEKIFADWDRDRDGVSDVTVPLTRSMYPEPTEDGHICILDPFKQKAWEMSGFSWPENLPVPRASTFNVWDLTGSGAGDPFYSGWRWQTRGGRGSGFPIIAGLLRPEELSAGEIRHALVFTFPKNRKAADGRNIFMPPASRSDGKHGGRQYPIEGMRFQLDPTLTAEDFRRWGLSREGMVIARALQRYGMFLGDNGGAMALQVQLLGPDEERNRQAWEELFPGLYRNVRRIPTDRFRVIYTTEPVIK